MVGIKPLATGGWQKWKEGCRAGSEIVTRGKILLMGRVWDDRALEQRIEALKNRNKSGTGWEKGYGSHRNLAGEYIWRSSSRAT